MKKLPFEHLGWLELRELDGLKHFLHDSINMNINVQPLALLGQRWGLEFIKSSSKCDDPFGINIDVSGGNITWTVYYDERFIDAETVSGLIRNIQSAFDLIVDGNRQDCLTVGDVLRTIQELK